MRTILLLSAALSTALLNAQAPGLMNYQAVVRDANNTLVVNAPVGMRVSIVQGTANGPEVYAETHTPQSNANGLVTVAIGGGVVETGSMAAIDWAAGPYFVRTETDPAGGTAYSITGVQQLLSVPYALYAANGGTQGPPGPPGPQGPVGQQGPSACDLVRTRDGRAVVYTTDAAYGFSNNAFGASAWVSTTLDGPVLGAAASDTIAVVYTATTAYAFGPTSTGSTGWVSTALNGSPLGAVASTGRVVVYTDAAGHGVGRTGTGSTGWTSITFNGVPLGHQASGNRVVVYTAAGAYGFGITGTGSSGWSSTTLSGAPVGSAGTR